MPAARRLAPVVGLVMSLAGRAEVRAWDPPQGERAPLAAMGLTVAGAAKHDVALAGLDESVQTAMANLGVPGLALAVVEGNRVVLARGYGWRDLDRQLPATASTVFPIGSATKPFTSFVLAQLCDEGRIDWFAPVRDMLPAFRLADPLATERLTVPDMLTHRSGLPRHDAVWFGNPGLTRAQLVARLQYLPPSTRFRSKFQYSNLMYVAAGHVAEVVTGESWEQLVTDRILTPLGMRRSVFSRSAAEALEDCARPYRDRDGSPLAIPIRDASAVAPAGGLWSSATDLASWVRLLLAHGQWEGRELIKPDTLAGLFRPITPTRNGVDAPEVSPSSYGLGWFVDSYRGHVRVSHGGNLDGFTSLVTLFPNADFGFVVLANVGATALPEALVRHLADRLLGLFSRDWLARAGKVREGVLGARGAVKSMHTKRRVMGTTPALPLAAYAGVYENPGYGVLRVELVGDHLEVLYNGIRAPLDHWNFETFNIGTIDDPCFEHVKLAFVTEQGVRATQVMVPFEPAVAPIPFRRVALPAEPGAWLRLAQGDYRDGASVVALTIRDGKPFVRWEGLLEGEVGATDEGDEARLATPAPAVVRFVPSTATDPARLMLFTAQTVRVATR